MSWKRWLKYGKARIDSAVRDVDHDLDRKEAELAAEQSGKPWLADDRDTPSFDDVRSRIEDRAAHAPGATPPPTAPAAAPAATPADGDESNLAIELAKQNEAAQERLAEIRKSLDLPDQPGKDR